VRSTGTARLLRYLFPASSFSVVSLFVLENPVHILILPDAHVYATDLKTFRFNKSSRDQPTLKSNSVNCGSLCDFLCRICAHRYMLYYIVYFMDRQGNPHSLANAREE